MPPRAVLSLVVAIMAAAACGSRGDSVSPPPPSTAAGPAATAAAAKPRIVFLGDSLTAGLGLPGEEAYPSLIQQRLNQGGFPYEVVNAGVSGDTSAGGLSRLDWALAGGDVRILVVALGGNDGLRGLPPEQLRHNLATIIERARARGIAVVLAGMEAPPNFGRDYIVAFHKVYPSLVRQFDVPFVPFLLQGVAGDASLNQPDGIHPNEAGARIVADNVWAVLKPMVEQQRGS